MKFLRKFPYWYLIVVPVLLFCLGVVSNQSVLIANHGKFPVMLNPAWMATQCAPIDKDDEEYAVIPAASCKKGGEMIDMTHSVMGPNSHLKALGDIIPLGRNIYSIGDGLLYLGDWLLSFMPFMWVALVLRKLYTTAD